jgi:hypothetical protein
MFDRAEQNRKNAPMIRQMRQRHLTPSIAAYRRAIVALGMDASTVNNILTREIDAVARSYHDARVDDNTAPLPSDLTMTIVNECLRSSRH